MSGLEPDPPAGPRFSYAVAFLERSIRRALNQTLEPFDLTVAQYTVLWLLGNREGLSNAQLARRAYITPQAMSELIRHLEERGLVAREPSRHHARVHPAVLTRRGHTTLIGCDAAVDDLERVMLAGTITDDHRQITELMMQGARSLEAHDFRPKEPSTAVI